MNMTDEIRRSLSDPKPFYALAGAGDLAAEKLRDAPDRFKDAPARLAEAGAALGTLANRLAAQAPEHLARVSATARETVGKAARPDTAALRDRAQTVALQQVGRLLEAAGKAVETYDELAERGRIVVGRYTGNGETVHGETVDPAVTVVVEQVSDEDEVTEGFAAGAAGFAEDAAGDFAAAGFAPEDVATVTEPQPDSAAEAATVFLDAEDGPSADEKPAAKKSARKRATPPKD